MKRLLYILSAIVIFGLTSCRAQKGIVPTPPVIVTNTDSIMTEYIETVRVDTVTIYVEIPAESAKQIVPDSTSHLETNFALSDAWINSDGTLGHSLFNKPQSIPVDAPVIGKDTQTNNTSEKIREMPIDRPVPVYIERDFTKWESFRLGAFRYLVGIVLASAIWIFRKPLTNLLRKCLFK